MQKANTINEYTVISSFNEGHLGQAFRVKSSASKEYVLKRIQINPDQGARIKEEAQILTKLGHPNIARIKESFLYNKKAEFIIVSEYCPKKLAISIQKSLTPEKRLQIVEGISKGVRELYNHKIIHGDIKLQNVLLDYQGNPKLTDVGLARIIAGHKGTRVSVTQMTMLLYIAPEIFNESTISDEKADVWSLGILFIQILLGKRIHKINSIIPMPITAEFFSQILEQVKDKMLSCLISKMLRFDPNQRVSMRQVVDQILGPEPQAELEQVTELEEGAQGAEGTQVAHQIVQSEGVYLGQRLNGQKHGRGIFWYAATADQSKKQRYQGEWYQGNWKHDRRDGDGILKWKNGSSYQGQWKEGNPNGYGKYIYPDKNQYEGWYKDGKQHGFGRYYWSNGDIRYQGQWQNGRMHGRGKYYWLDGRTYDGQYNQGNMQGQGKLSLAGGQIYVGEFINGKRHGRGTFFHVNGYRYVGSWCQDNKQGRGTVYCNHRIVYEGWFDKNQYHGTGRYYFKGGNMFQGKYEYGKRHGSGIFVKGGQRFTEIWQNGILQSQVPA